MFGTRTPWRSAQKKGAVLLDPDTRKDFEAIVAGCHGDPFSVLGPHKYGDKWTVTIFAPGAESVRIEHNGHVINGVQDPDYPEIFVATVPDDGPYAVSCENADAQWMVDDPYRFGSVLGEIDEYLLAEGSQRRLWKSLGAHTRLHEGVRGVHFAVWAPNARRVSVVGDFNFWDNRRHPMRRLAPGIWDLFIPGLTDGALYKFDILDADGMAVPQKADPVGFGAEHPPATASVVRSLETANWTDQTWMETRAARHAIDAPISIYEVHLGSWRRADDGARRLSYTELASELVDYVDWMGFTHIECLPISEHPFDGSWGYQPVGLYAPTIRHGTPDEFRALVDAAHRKGLGVLIDWVPAHFPTDAHGLGRFDGTALYEHVDPKEGFHQDWNTLIYNLGRREVSNYLISNALYWLEEYHVDGLRVDAVASMLYRDYSRADGEWIPNMYGGRENLEAIAFFKAMNTLSYGEVPGIMTIAEESTAFDGVTRLVDNGGLGFGYKWNMGWMNDTLDYMQRATIHRRHHHHQMTFGLDYAFSENYVLPISHDEVVHGKGSMIAKMPGTHWEKFANLRAYYAFMWTQPGKKLLFMGCEFAQSAEWNHDQSLDWHEADAPMNRGIQILVRDLNHMMRATPALYVNDTKSESFQWLEGGAANNSVFAYLRCAGPEEKRVAVILNLTPIERSGYRLGLPAAGHWREILNTDAKIYGGEDRGNFGGVEAEAVAWHGQEHSAVLTLPPLSALVLLET